LLAIFNIRQCRKGRACQTAVCRPYWWCSYTSLQCVMHRRPHTNCTSMYSHKLAYRVQ
jgi:hypothetical protein